MNKAMIDEMIKILSSGIQRREDYIKTFEGSENPQIIKELTRNKIEKEDLEAFRYALQGNLSILKCY